MRERDGLTSSSGVALLGAGGAASAEAFPATHGEGGAVRHIEVSGLGTDLALVALYGEHDVATNGELVDELRTLVRAGHSVIVDLSQVEFIDSTVLTR